MIVDETYDEIDSEVQKSFYTSRFDRWKHCQRHSGFYGAASFEFGFSATFLFDRLGDRGTESQHL